jgi:galactosamine-6-phosphate isomerase
VEKARTEKVDFSSVSFIALDEWVGIPPDNAGSCFFFLHNNVFKPLGIRAEQTHLFDALSKDLPSECAKMDSVIRKKGGIDLMLVGVGMNAHVGFNEPGVAADLKTHVVELDATTQLVGQKYFNQSTKLQFGITLGLVHFLSSRKALMLASGKKKAEVMRLTLEDPITTNVPASIIRKHPGGIVMLDEDAASLLKV